MLQADCYSKVFQTTKHKGISLHFGAQYGDLSWNRAQGFSESPEWNDDGMTSVNAAFFSFILLANSTNRVIIKLDFYNKKHI